MKSATNLKPLVEGPLKDKANSSPFARTHTDPPPSFGSTTKGLGRILVEGEGVPPARPHWDKDLVLVGELGDQHRGGQLLSRMGLLRSVSCVAGKWRGAKTKGRRL